MTRKQMIDEMIEGKWCFDSRLFADVTDEEVQMFYKQFNDQKGYEDNLNEHILEALSRTNA
jgi:hypothetical protein